MKESSERGYSPPSTAAMEKLEAEVLFSVRLGAGWLCGGPEVIVDVVWEGV